MRNLNQRTTTQTTRTHSQAPSNANLRNVGISAHIDSGKTTLTERMLFYCGRIHAIHEVRGGDGGATMDSNEIERKRGITIMSAVTRVGWNDHFINLINTPGHVDFTVEVERSLRVLDGAILVLCSVGGVQSQSMTVDRQMRRNGVPRIAFINKMDRTGADSERVIAQMRDRLDTNAVALQIPIGHEDNFRGVVDLVTMRAVYFDGEYGQDVRHEEIPGPLLAEAQLARTKMLESLGMLDDSIMETLLNGREPELESVRRVIRQATMAHQPTPVLLGSAYKNKGVQEVLDAVTMYLPSPGEREIFANDHSKVHYETQNEAADLASGATPNPNQVRLANDPERPMVAMAFKTIIERFGQLTFLRVYQGRIEIGGTYRNARTGKTIRVGRLVRIHADQREQIGVADAGEIIGVVGIECASGDTFTSGELNLSLEAIVVAEPVMRLSIAPADRGDANKLSKALDRFRREDPTFQVVSDPETGETLIAGMGQLHLEVYVERIRTDYDCECIVGHPCVAYKERLSRPVDFVHRYKKQTGGPGQFAQIVGRVEPLSVDALDRYEFEDEITGRRVERKYISAVESGFRDSLSRGPLGGFEVVGARMTLRDGNQHEKDSSEISFQNCVKQAMREKVFPEAAVQIWEPIMRLEIEVPTDFQGSVTAHLGRIRGIVTFSEVSDLTCVINAEVPLAELFDYAIDLRSMTQGNGAFSMEPFGYRQTPPAVQDEVLKRMKAN